MAPKITTVFWDLDGTLIESEHIHQEAAYHAAKQLGHQCAPSTTAVPGIQNSDAFELIFKKPFNKANLELFTRWENLMVEYAINRIGSKDLIAPAVNLFTQLSKLGIKQSVVSNSPKIIIEHSLRQLGVSELCYQIFSRDQVDYGKPHPQLYLNAINFHKESPEKCLVFEDSQTGISAAKAAGITSIIGVGKETTQFNPSIICNKDENNWFSLIQALIS